MKRNLFLLSLIFAVITAVVDFADSEIYTFTQNTPFVFGDATIASDLSVTGVMGNVTDVNVILNGVKVNTFVNGISEFDVLLVSPMGQKVILTSFVCKDTAGPLDFTFDNLAPGPLPSGFDTTCVSGTYLPSDYNVLAGGYILDPPAPPPPYSTDLNSLNGSIPNGFWSLWAREFAGDQGGTIDNWTLMITTDSDPSSCTYQNDFNDGLLEWVEEKPTVTESNGFLNLTPLKRKAIVVADAAFGAASIGTYTHQVQFTGGATSKNWLYISRVDKKNSLEVLAKVDQGKLVIKDRLGSVKAKAKGAFMFTPNTPYTFVTTYDGTNVDVFINGTPVIVDFVPSRVLPAANTGAAAKLNSMSIDNFCFE